MTHEIQRPTSEDVKHLDDRIERRIIAGDSELSPETSMVVAKRLSAIAYRSVVDELGNGEESDAADTDSDHEAIASALEFELEVAKEAIRRQHDI